MWGKKKLFLIPLLAVMGFSACFLLVDLCYPLDLAKLKHQSQQILSDKGELLHLTLADDDVYRMPVKVSEVSERYLNLLIAREDHRFYSHWGVDLKAIMRAISQNIKAMQVISGASTLTMQTARLLEPRPRNLSSKLIEMFRALQLEWRFSKDEILKIYLNLVPCGGNVEGVKAASYTYFGKSPDRLSVAEAAFLVMLPQAPSQLRPDRYPEAARLKRDGLLSYFHEKGLILENEFAYALTENIPESRFAFPRELPHFKTYVNSKNHEVHSFIDGDVQRFLKHILDTSDIFPKGANAAILVHDHLDNKVIGYAGSRDFFDMSNAGQVDFIQAIRSPGSTLKPLIFGLAFDGGHITPETYFFDERKHFGAYSPRNFDHQHYGLVRGAESLQMSLNIPAVELLKKIGPIHFYGAMKDMNLNPRFKNPNVMPNLSMALGGVGLSLEDLVKLYSCFAEEGMARDLRFLKTQEKPHTRYMIYPSAAQQLTKILNVNPLNIRGHLAHRPVALKTGTSYGYRDALALAYDERYTVGVWVGMPNGSSLGAYTGLDLAVPFIEMIFQKLPKPHMSIESSSLDLPPGFKIKPLVKEHVFVKAKDLTQRPLAIHYPFEGACLLYEKKKPVQVKLGGGKKPYRIFVNGKVEKQALWRDEMSWNPHEKGFYSLTVQDAEGHIVTSDVEVMCHSLEGRNDNHVIF